jgi:segregation and condensation protein B
VDFLQNHVEALIFCSPQAITPEEIRQCLNEMFGAELPEADVLGAIDALRSRYAQEDFAFELVSSGGGVQFMTKPAYQASIGIYLKQQAKKRLSASAMETLAIVAYKQPVTKLEVEQIRGVNCDYAIQKLLAKELIAIKGKSDRVGRPLLYGTGPRFEEHFGINSLQDLPTPKDFSSEENKIGQEQ